MKRAFVAGAGGAVGEAATLALLRDGWRVTASMHQPREGVRARLLAAGADVQFHELNGDSAWRRDAESCDALIFTTHLALTCAALSGSEPKRLVAFSSNNIAADPDAPSYRALAESEAELRAAFPDTAIIRPTLIYGDPRLATIARLMRLAQRLPVLPLAGSGRAKVQPVFHADLGALAAGLAAAPVRGAFAAGGPEIVSMRALYAEVARALNVSRLILPLPPVLLKAVGVISAEQAERAEVDRIAIAQDAIPEALRPRTMLQAGLTHLADLFSEAQRAG